MTDEDGDHVPLIKTWAADLFFGILIVVSALLLGVDIELSLQQINTFKDVLFWIQFGFLVMFVVELIMRVWVDGCKYFLFFPICWTPSSLDALLWSTLSLLQLVMMWRSALCP